MQVSVITICYNSRDCIARTIESVLKQTDKHMEYLIIDGASEDGTVQMAEGYRRAMEDAGISYRIISQPDEGIYDAMNKGIREATGEIIGILNSGDTYEEIAVETARRTFEETGCELMFGHIRMHKTDGGSFIKRARQRRFQTSRDWNHPTTFVKAQVQKENPFPRLGIHDDYGFYLRMRRQKRRIVTVDKVLANFYMGGASNEKSLRAARKRIKDRYRYCYRRNGYSRLYILECVAIEAAKMILG
ncbi:MAG: glycosyltransferase [Lachnospiraceae bacterium]|nr:glycosyltransferase [Lachnospiraceae bacterium]